MGTDAVAESHDAVRLIRLNRPDHGNGMAGTLLDDLIRHGEEAARNDDVRAIVTIGTGSMFSIGADFDELDLIGSDDLVDVVNSGRVGGEESMLSSSRQQRQLDSLGIGRWTLRFCNIDKPTVAAVNGGAAGGGFALAMMHDFRIMSSSARITPGFARLGLGPEMGVGWLLPRIVGWQRARDLLFRCPTLTAEQALSIGLVDEVVEPAELEARALEYATDLTKQPALGVRATKRLLSVSADLPLDRYLEREWTSQLRLFGTQEMRAALDMTTRSIRGR